MAAKKSKAKAKTGGRAKPLAHTPGLTRTQRRYGCGGQVSKKNS